MSGTTPFGGARLARVRWLACALLVACGDCDTKASRKGQPSGGALPVVFAGCAVVHRGPRCELHPEPRNLTLWVSGEPSLELTVDGAALTPMQLEYVEAGQRLRVAVPASAKRLTVVDATSGRRFVLPITAGEPVPALERAAQLRAAGEHARSRSSLERAMASLSPAQQTRARALLARIAIAEGDYSAAAAGLEETMRSALEAGRSSDALSDATALSYVLSRNLNEYARARQVLTLAGESLQDDPAARALLPHYRGVLAQQLGDLSQALSLFREAARNASRLGLLRHELFARQELSEVLSRLGRHHEALEVQLAIIAAFPDGDACRAVDVREQLVWLGILAELPEQDAYARKLEHSSQQAEAALARCGDPWRRRNHQINLGLRALQRLDLEAAEAALSVLPAADQGNDALLSTWELELRGRIALRRGDAPSALGAFEAALVRSQRASLWDNEQLALVGVGRSRELLGDAAGAVQAYLQAEAALDRLLGGLPFGEGRGGFLRARGEGTQRLVALLVQLGRAPQGLAVARKARARLMRSVAHGGRLARMDAAERVRWEAAITRYQQARHELERSQADAWKLPADQLRQTQASFERQRQQALQALDSAHALLRPHEVEQLLALPGVDNEALIAFFPLDDTSLVGFLARSGRVLAQRLPRLPTSATPAEHGAAWVAPFAQSLAGVETLRVILHGELSGRDVHAFELDGHPILERFAVVYALDTPLPDAAVSASGVLIVADPTGDLPAARREAEATRVVLGAEPSALLIGEQASRQRVLEALPSASLLHYAGHGQHGGFEGADSGLRLYDGTLLMGDILARTSAPALVVLSACEGSAKVGTGFAASMGVGEAFVVAGAAAVVAATRPVADDSARALFGVFYQARTGAQPMSVEAALRHAQLRLRAVDPDADWSSFRVLVP